MINNSIIIIIILWFKYIFFRSARFHAEFSTHFCFDQFVNTVCNLDRIYFNLITNLRILPTPFKL